MAPPPPKPAPQQQERQFRYKIRSRRTAKPGYAASIERHDVLFGRGTGINDLPGNVAFRTIVQQHAPGYVHADGIRGQKTRIIFSVIKQIHSKNGRFLRKLDPAERRRIQRYWLKKREEGASGDVAAATAVMNASTAASRVDPAISSSVSASEPNVGSRRTHNSASHQKSPAPVSKPPSSPYDSDFESLPVDELLAAKEIYSVINDKSTLILKTKQAFRHAIRTGHAACAVAGANPVLTGSSATGALSNASDMATAASTATATSFSSLFPSGSITGRFGNNSAATANQQQNRPSIEASATTTTAGLSVLRPPSSRSAGAPAPRSEASPASTPSDGSAIVSPDLLQQLLSAMEQQQQPGYSFQNQSRLQDFQQSTRPNRIPTRMETNEQPTFHSIDQSRPTACASTDGESVLPESTENIVQLYLMQLLMPSSTNGNAATATANSSNNGRIDANGNSVGVDSQTTQSLSETTLTNTVQQQLQQQQQQQQQQWIEQQAPNTALPSSRQHAESQLFSDIAVAVNAGNLLLSLMQLLASTNAHASSTVHSNERSQGRDRQRVSSRAAGTARAPAETTRMSFTALGVGTQFRAPTATVSTATLPSVQRTISSAEAASALSQLNSILSRARATRPTVLSQQRSGISRSSIDNSDNALAWSTNSQFASMSTQTPGYSAGPSAEASSSPETQANDRGQNRQRRPLSQP